MIIIGHDPSLAYYGLAAIEVDTKALAVCGLRGDAISSKAIKVLRVLCVETMPDQSKAARIEKLSRGLERFCTRDFQPVHHAIEVFTGAQSSAAATSLASSLACGIACAVGTSPQNKPVYFSPREVKRTACDVDATKTQVTDAMCLRFGIELEKKRVRYTKQAEAIGDALAVANALLLRGIV